jgi:hypothetical protein
MAEENREAAEAEDAELTAMKTVLGALKDLDPDARTRVIEYVFNRLGIQTPDTLAPSPTLVPGTLVRPVVHHIPSTAAVGTPTDLWSLRDQKQPKNVNQMLAVLAYYLANLAPTNERRDYIKADDIKRYFPQANFELPARADQSLVNAKAAGYFDVPSTGQYRLNPVGHNLVTHKLPLGEGARVIRRGKKTTAKKSKKKANK